MSSSPYDHPSISPRELRAILRRDFGAFAGRCFEELNPQTPLLHNWHQDLLASKLQACFDGKIRRLIINIPPRNGKSILASVALPAFWLGHRPSDQVICVSYNQPLANTNSNHCRAVMSTDWYQEIFPTRISPKRAAVEECATTRMGFRMATSVGGTLTGRGANLIIIDDPLKPDEAMSNAQREAVNAWYDQSLLSRLNQKGEGCIILVMQRLHLDDLVGHVLEQEPWEVVSLPAIALEDEHHLYSTFMGDQEAIRKAGEALHPERESLEILQRLRAAMGDYAFDAQYQQSPVPQGGAIVKEEWLTSYDQVPAQFEQIIQSWDTALTEGERSDFSVCTTWGLLKGQMYLLQVLRDKLNYPDLKRAVMSQATIHKATAILIEDRVSGTPLIQELQRDGLNKVHARNPLSDKVTRLHVQTPWFSGGNVLLPKAAPWLAEYRRELLAFPKTTKDDQVDSTTQALAWAAEVRPAFSVLVARDPRREQLHRDLDSYLGSFGAPAFPMIGW